MYDYVGVSEDNYIFIQASFSLSTQLINAIKIQNWCL